MYRAELKQVSRKLRPQTSDSENSDRENSGHCWCDPSVTLIGRERTNSSWVCLGVRWIIQRHRFQGKARFWRWKSGLKSTSEKQTFPVTNQAISLKLPVYLDFQSYFFELATGIHYLTVLCKIRLLSKLINKSIHSQNGRKNSQNNANQCSLMSHWTSIWYAVATLLLSNCRYQTSAPVNSFQRGSCRPSEGSPRPSAFFSSLYLTEHLHPICGVRKPSLLGHWPEIHLLSGTLQTDRKKDL